MALRHLTAAWGSLTGNISDNATLQSALDAKQNVLISGTNIKTINSQSILGSGNLDVGGATPNLQDVTDVGAVTTNVIGANAFQIGDAIPNSVATAHGLIFKSQEFNDKTYLVDKFSYPLPIEKTFAYVDWSTTPLNINRGMTEIIAECSTSSCEIYLLEVNKFPNREITIKRVDAGFNSSNIARIYFTSFDVLLPENVNFLDLTQDGESVTLVNDGENPYWYIKASKQNAGATAGSNEQIIYNNGGVLTGSNNVKIRDDLLNLEAIASTTVTSSGLKFYSKAHAGLLLPTYMDNLVEHIVQPAIFDSKIARFSASGNSNGTTADGLVAPTTTGFTATPRTVATTNLFTREKRQGYVTAGTAGAVGQFRAPNGQYTVGNGSIGGFFFAIRFGISDAALVSDARMFLGVGIAGAPTNVEPSTLTNIIGIGHGASDTNLKIFYGGSAAQTPINLGANFPCNTQSVDLYDFFLYAPPNSPSTVYWLVKRLNSLHTASGSITGGSTHIPLSTQLLAIPWGYRTNNATAAAVALDVSQYYIANNT